MVILIALLLFGVPLAALPHGDALHVYCVTDSSEASVTHNVIALEHSIGGDQWVVGGADLGFPGNFSAVDSWVSIGYNVVDSAWVRTIVRLSREDGQTTSVVVDSSAAIVESHPDSVLAIWDTFRAPFLP